MRRLLTNGIKAILAIAVLTTAAHWAFRVQREPAKSAMAMIPDPVTTGSIEPRKVERAIPAPLPVATAPVTQGLDQLHLMQLMSATDKPKAAAVAAKPTPAKQTVAKPAAVKTVAAKATAKPAPAKPEAKPNPGKQVLAAR